jgi:EAL domain-containing protein (putative c-di-GMP-specific phosphodiesterase class I)
VVAEGIETRGQLERVRNLKCDYGQGFFFSKAVDCVKAGEMIAEWGRKDHLA